MSGKAKTTKKTAKTVSAKRKAPAPPRAAPAKPAAVQPLASSELQAVLGAKIAIWDGIVRAIEGLHAPLCMVWKPANITPSGRMCALQHKKRTLLYLLPMQGEVLAAVILGERAYGLAMASDLPEVVKTMLSEAKPYAEGRGIRFAVGRRDIPTVTKLVELKTMPK